MAFPLGRTILAMVVCSLITGGVLICRQSPVKADLTLWVFADLHAKMYRGEGQSISPLEEFHSRTGRTVVQLDLIAAPALDVRLLSLFMFAGGNHGKPDSAWPDVVEVPMASIGKYFRPPVEEIGFLPLNGFLAESGILPSRFSPWSKGGQIFGVPHDLHPCSITYRRDLFDQAGVDLESAATWEEFQQECLKFQQYWSNHGQPRAALALSSTGPDQLLVMLHQQRVVLVDADLSLHLSDPQVISTLCWYAQVAAGPNHIGADANPAAGQASADLASGDICAMITPDWMIADLKQYSPELAGKLHMMPLPRFSTTDARTASWGGTMIGITRTCPNPQLAWKLIQTLYLNPAALPAQSHTSGILPPIPALWSNPVFHQPDPFFGGQKIDELYIQLAKELPPAKMTAYTVFAQTLLTMTLNRAIARIRSDGSSNLPLLCRQWLQSAQLQLAAMIRFDQP